MTIPSGHAVAEYAKKFSQLFLHLAEATNVTSDINNPP